MDNTEEGCYKQVLKELNKLNKLKKELHELKELMKAHEKELMKAHEKAHEKRTRKRTRKRTKRRLCQKVREQFEKLTGDLKCKDGGKTSTNDTFSLMKIQEACWSLGITEIDFGELSRLLGGLNYNIIPFPIVTINGREASRARARAADTDDISQEAYKFLIEHAIVKK